MSIPESKNEITLNNFTIRKDSSNDKPFIFECGEESKFYKFKKDLVKKVKTHIKTEDNKEALKVVNEKLGIVKKEKVQKPKQNKQTTIKNNEFLEVFKSMSAELSSLHDKINDLTNKVEEVIIKQNQFSTTYRKIEKIEDKINNIYDVTEEIQETETKTFHKLGKVEMFFDNLDEDKINQENQELKNNVKLISENLNKVVLALNNNYVEQTQAFNSLMTEEKQTCEEEPLEEELDDIIEEHFPFEEVEEDLKENASIEISKSSTEEDSEEEALDYSSEEEEFQEEEILDLNEYLSDEEEEEKEEDNDEEFDEYVKLLEQLPEELQTISNVKEALEAIKNIENKIKEKEEQIQKEKNKIIKNTTLTTQQEIEKGLKEGYYTKVKLRDSVTNKSQMFIKHIKDVYKGEVLLLTSNLQKAGIVRLWKNDGIIPNEELINDEDIVTYEGEELWEYIITEPTLSRLDKNIFREFKYIEHYDDLQETNEVRYNC